MVDVCDTKWTVEVREDERTGNVRDSAATPRGRRDAFMHVN